MDCNGITKARQVCNKECQPDKKYCDEHSYFENHGEFTDILIDSITSDIVDYKQIKICTNCDKWTFCHTKKCNVCRNINIFNKSILDACDKLHLLEIAYLYFDSKFYFTYESILDDAKCFGTCEFIKDATVIINNFELKYKNFFTECEDFVNVFGNLTSALSNDKKIEMLNTTANMENDKTKRDLLETFIHNIKISGNTDDSIDEAINEAKIVFMTLKLTELCGEYISKLKKKISRMDKKKVDVLYI